MDKSPADHAAPGEVVVLVHGLGPGRLPMWPLARRLARAGYQTINWRYPCLRHTIEAHGRRLHELLESLAADPKVQGVHLVVYSMGGIVARYALSLGRPAKLGRVVMLAAPNQGSRWADWFGPPLRCCIRTIDQLATRPGGFVHSLPEEEPIEIGVIAARFDLLVGRSSPHLRNEQDYIVLNGPHSLLPLRRDTADEVRQFLAHGRFRRSTSSAAQLAGSAAASNSALDVEPR